jgi:hypothetical protein
MVTDAYTIGAAGSYSTGGVHMSVELRGGTEGSQFLEADIVFAN